MSPLQGTRTQAQAHRHTHSLAHTHPHAQVQELNAARVPLREPKMLLPPADVHGRGGRVGGGGGSVPGQVEIRVKLGLDFMATFGRAQPLQHQRAGFVRDLVRKKGGGEGRERASE